MNETPCAMQVRSHALRFLGDLIRLKAETRWGFIPTCQHQEATNVSFGNRSEVGKACGPNSPFSVKLLSLFDHFITPWELKVLTIYRLIGFPGSCNLCCYCVLGGLGLKLGLVVRKRLASLGLESSEARWSSNSKSISEAKGYSDWNCNGLFSFGNNGS